jgi:hypothetical protein
MAVFFMKKGELALSGLPSLYLDGYYPELKTCANVVANVQFIEGVIFLHNRVGLRSDYCPTAD